MTAGQPTLHSQTIVFGEPLPNVCHSPRVSGNIRAKRSSGKTRCCGHGSCHNFLSSVVLRMWGREGRHYRGNFAGIESLHDSPEEFI